MVIITVYIVNMKRQIIKIKIDYNIIIYALKQKIGCISSELRFYGEVLKDDKRLKDYKIEDGDELICVFRNIGWEVGSYTKGFTAPTKVIPDRYAITTDGPDYLIVEKGINFFCNCVNKKCIGYNKELSSPFGFGIFV